MLQSLRRGAAPDLLERVRDGASPAPLGTLLQSVERDAAGIPIDAFVLQTAPGVYEIPDSAPLTNFRPRFNPGRLQVKEEDGGLRLYSRRGPWKDGARLLAADRTDPELFAVEAEGYPRERIILARNGRGEVEAIRLSGLVEMVQNPELEPWA